MCEVLQQLIGPERVSPRLDLTEDVSYRMDPSDYKQYHVICGHLGVVWNKTLGLDRRWMTMLRNPVHRVVSQYYFWRNHVPATPHLRHVYLAQTLSLEEFILSREEKALQGNENVQTWLLADDFRVRYRRVTPGDALEVARGHLAEQCAFVGIFEEYTTSIERLCQLLGVPLPSSIPALNPAGPQLLETIHPRVINAIRELNTLDHELYEYGKEIASQQC